MAYKAPPFYSGHYGRMADLSLQRGQQQADAIRQTWGAVGNVLPSTIGQIHQYQQDEQQRQYYDTVKKRQDFAHQQEIQVRDNQRLYDNLFADHKGRFGDMTDTLNNMDDKTFASQWGTASRGGVGEIISDNALTRQQAVAQQIQNNLTLQDNIMSEAVVPLSRVLKDPNPNSQYVAWNRFMNGVGDTPGFRSRVQELDAQLGTEFAKQLPEFADMQAFTTDGAGPDAIQRVWDGLVTMDEMRATTDHNVEQYGLMVAADKEPVENMTPDYRRAFEVSAMPLVAEEFLDDQNDADIQESMARVRDMYPTNGQWLIDEFMKKVNPAEYEDPPVGPAPPGGAQPVVRNYHPATALIEANTNPNDPSFTTAIQNWQSQIYAIKEGQPNVAQHGLDWMQVGTLNALGRGADVPNAGTVPYHRVMSWWRDQGGQRGQEMWDDYVRDMESVGKMKRDANGSMQLTANMVTGVNRATNTLIRDDQEIYSRMGLRGSTEPERRAQLLTGEIGVLFDGELQPVMPIDIERIVAEFGADWRSDVTNPQIVSNDEWNAFIDGEAARNTLLHLEQEAHQLNIPSYQEAEAMFSAFVESDPYIDNLMSIATSPVERKRIMEAYWNSLEEPEKVQLWNSFLREVPGMATGGAFGEQYMGDHWDIFGDFIDRFAGAGNLGDPFYKNREYNPAAHMPN